MVCSCPVFLTMSKEAASGPPREYVRTVSSSMASTGAPMFSAARGVLRDHQLLGRLAAFHLSVLVREYRRFVARVHQDRVRCWPCGNVFVIVCSGVAVSVGGPRRQGLVNVTRHRYVGGRRGVLNGVSFEVIFADVTVIPLPGDAVRSHVVRVSQGGRHREANPAAAGWRG